MKRVDPETVRNLVRRELERRLLTLPSPTHPSHQDIAQGPECTEDHDFPVRKPCLIEPHRLCYSSGYCRKLGY